MTTATAQLKSKQSKPSDPASNTAWHILEVDEVLRRLGVSADSGLSDAEAAKRLENGRNELIERAATSPLAILWEQLTSPLVLLLILAAAISGVLGKWDSLIAITAIVILNAALGVFQEYRAEQAMAALKKMAAPLVRVRRSGRVVDVKSPEIVAGDIVLLEAGSIVPADARLIVSANLSVQEASLTGESVPVDKMPPAIEDPNAPLGDRFNTVYMGTAVTYGRGEAVVVEIGMQTQLGRIAEAIQSVDNEATPLQRRMAEVGRVLLYGALIVMVIAFIVGLIVQDPLQDILLNSVAIAVAVVPEGLPAVVTVALALGAQRMLRRRALIRKLPAVETLGSVTTICSDKTGTLTENKMTVTIVDVAGNKAAIQELVREGAPALLKTNGDRPLFTSAQAILLAGDALCNDSDVERTGPNPEDISVIGDPTETALVVAAARYGFEKQQLQDFLPRVSEVPFTSERKRMTTIHAYNAQVTVGAQEQKLLEFFGLQSGEYIAFTKGAVDMLLDATQSVWEDDQILPMTPGYLKRINAANDQMAADGLRVLGLAFRKFESHPEQTDSETIERNLVFVGMVGIIDPPRTEVRDAVATCRMAGIRPVMITGDHPLTAFNIAKQLGIAKDGDRVVTGHELAYMSMADLEKIVEQVSVFARVAPEHKLNIVQALQKRGHVVAMTGDGVNDAPALKRSDIGIAMGITGTAVSKEAADMILTDDNFATIVSAVEEGRTIYENIRRFVKYLLASNTGELIVLLFTQLIEGMSLPLTTLQILWMNLITDGVPALALGIEQGEKGGMKRPPYPSTESIFGRGMARHIFIVGATMGITGLAIGYLAFRNYEQGMADFGPRTWSSMVFIFLTLAQMGHALALRSHRETIFRIGITGNKLLLGAVIFTIIVQLGAVYIPFLNDLFKTTPLTLSQLALCLVLSTIVFWVVELEKLAIRLTSPKVTAQVAMA
jgi:Ca2+-transporting ATPase